MICLPDVNLWIGLTSNRHIHHARAKAWLEGMEDARIAFAESPSWVCCGCSPISM